MRISRIVVKNFRSLQLVDVPVNGQATCVIGENNTGKSAFIHAIRLCLDVALPSNFRSLLNEDINTGVDRTKPFQVLVGVEFAGFEGNEREEALLHGTQTSSGHARIFYRFRPKRPVRDSLARKDRDEASLTLEDYGWELAGGGNPAFDLPDFEWNTENEDIGATAVGFQYLQSFLVVFLHALRDVEGDLAQLRRSPLARLIEATKIDSAEQAILINAVKSANAIIEDSPTIEGIAGAIDTALKQVTGPAFSMDVGLGLTDPSFQSIMRAISVLLSTASVKEFETRCNGLGLNNILYISIYLEYLRKRAALGKAAGELLLIEEPEAHLHPQLQLTLLEALRALPFQSIMTTHSTHVTAKAPLASFVLLTNRGAAAPSASVLSRNPALSPADIEDLERYLDATKSNLLFARKVMLVEGPAELFLIPPLVQKVMGRDLEREGISVVAIHGVHFGAFARLFRDDCLPKRCAIVADADLEPGGGADGAQAGDDEPQKPVLAALAGPHVQAFLGATTFEREITIEGNLSMLGNAARELGAVRAAGALELANIIGGPTDDALKDQVLRTARRFGKARFAQVAARHVAEAQSLPAYIRNAVDWLLAP